MQDTFNYNDTAWTSDHILDEKENIITEKKITYNDKSEYIGSILKGQRSGKGLFKGKNGLVYEGEWKNDLYQGFGSLINENNTVYTGTFESGRKEGNGKYIVGKTIYEGEFSNDAKNGKGKEFYQDGSTYNGQFIDGLKCGIGKILNLILGKYVLNDGSYYKGEFSNDCIEGFVNIFF